MQEFSSIIASSYDAESLAPMLTEKTGEGWSVVSIVAAGTNIVAYLSRDTDTHADAPSSDPAAADPVPADPADAPTQGFTPSSAPVEEPAGWGAVDNGPAAMETSDAPNEDAAVDDAGTAVTGAAALTDLSTDDSAGESAPDTPEEPSTPDATASEVDSAVSTEPEADAGSETPTGESAPADSGVPAGWYADPSGRYELRYWDGAAWTEHVSRAGQQYTDPPVA